jgi:hypothetical protein
MSEPVKTPIIDQSTAIQAAYDWLNCELFEGLLPPAMLVLSRNNNVLGGYFTPDRWFDEDGKAIPEIAINANCLKQAGIVKAMVVLAHEMVHLWQYTSGSPSRAGYHNQEWADKAKEIGLVPFTAEGKCTGQSVDTRLLPDGVAEMAIANMPEEFTLPWMTEPMDIPQDKEKGGQQEGQGQGEGGEGQGNGQEQGGSGQGGPPEGQGKGVRKGIKDGTGQERKPGTRNKYTCPACGFNLWGKPGGNFECLDCNQVIIEMKGVGDEDEKA